MKSLTKQELDALLTVARKYSESDYLMLLVTFNHGLRVSETVNLTKTNVVDGFLVVQRLKGSKKTAQPLLPNEREGLLKLAQNDGPLFPMSRWTANRRIEAYGTEAGIPPQKLHMHALKHTCGRLGYKGGMGVPELVSYLGHKNPGNSLIYMQADEEEAARAFAAAVGQ